MTIADDIHTHALTKLNQLLRDTSVVCRIAEIDDNEIVELLMSVLLQELVKGAACIAINETDFLHLCRVAYRAIYKLQRQKMQNETSR
jgi:hypothetical protein